MHMAVGDPVADMLTRIRNGLMVRKDVVEMPCSNLKKGVAEVLEREGYIKTFRVIEDNKQGVLRVYLKFGPEGEQVISGLKRVSKPGMRVYRNCTEIEKVLRGLGIAILSTPKGILSDRECRKQKVGGELLCFVW